VTTFAPEVEAARSVERAVVGGWKIVITLWPPA
jgi:hypothetical protein